MTTNANMTVIRYEEEVYSSIYIPSVMWQDTHKSSQGENGRYADNRAYIYIPLSSIPHGFVIRVGDAVIRGKIDNVTTSEQYIQLMKRSDLHKVVSVSKKDYCSDPLKHWSVVCER